MQEVKQQQSYHQSNTMQILQHNPINNFSNNFPAVQITSKHYSLDADIATGWKPKVRILGPIPLNFDSKILDQIVDQLTSFGRKYKERIIYLGIRFQNSFKMHHQIKRTYQFKYQGVINSNYLHMAAYFRKFHSNFKSKITRIFKGMNPTIPKNQQLIFDSNFQSGNLDTVIKLNQNQYDLFMRIDSNTKGHFQWFNFTVKNCGKKKIKLNIVNFRKAKTMYSRGMKPYIFSQFLKQTKQLNWFQGGENVKFTRKNLNYPFLEDYYTQDQMTFYCLSFQYQFNTDWEQVQFAYAPPFTYTDNNEMIKNLRLMNRKLMKQNHCIDSYLKQQILCQSLGGLQLPLLSITDPTIQDKKKKCVVLSGRIHPGQPCGSYMMKGFLQFICSEKEQAKYLRQNIVFKVIPMLNPDGVTIGNFRTSLCGKDLNRTFKMNNDILIPEVRALKELVIKLKQQWKSKLLFFFDFHGHSMKKNVFLYGPQYEIWQNGYYKTRLFPKLLADRTQIFRYYSCLFRIAEFKKTTARAVLLRNIPHCYTIQASTGFYYSTEEKKDIPFTTQKYELMGQNIAKTIKDYIDLIYDEQVTRQQRKQKLSELKMMKSNRTKSKKQKQRGNNNGNNLNKNNKFQSRKIQLNSLGSNNPNDKEEDNKIDEGKKKQPFANLSSKARQMIQKIKRQEEQKVKDQGHQSDKFSQGGSDSQSQNQDLNQEDLNKLHQDILQSMKQFREKIGVKQIKNSRQYSFKQEKTKQNLKPKPIEVIASLRHKLQKTQKAKVKQLNFVSIRQDLKLQKIKNSSSKAQKSTVPNSRAGVFLPKPSIKSSIGRSQEQINQASNEGGTSNVIIQMLQKQHHSISLKQELLNKNLSRNSLNKITNVPGPSFTKNRLYSVVQRNKSNQNSRSLHNQQLKNLPLNLLDSNNNKADQLLEEEFYKLLNKQKRLQNQAKQFEDKQIIQEYQQYQYQSQYEGASINSSNNFEQIQTLQTNKILSYYPKNSHSPNVFKKYASQLQRKNLTTKLKNLGQLNNQNHINLNSNPHSNQYNHNLLLDSINFVKSSGVIAHKKHNQIDLKKKTNQR